MGNSLKINDNERLEYDLHLFEAGNVSEELERQGFKFDEDGCMESQPLKDFDSFLEAFEKDIMFLIEKQREYRRFIFKEFINDGTNDMSIYHKADSVDYLDFNSDYDWCLKSNNYMNFTQQMMMDMNSAVCFSTAKLVDELLRDKKIERSPVTRKDRKGCSYKIKEGEEVCAAIW